jgi:hypothetical protein
MDYSALFHLILFAASVDNLYYYQKHTDTKGEHCRDSA